MKKIISMLLASALVLSMAACAKDEPTETRPPEPTAPTATEQVDTTEATEATPEETKAPIAPAKPTENVEVMWDEIKGDAVVFYGKPSDEVKASLDAALKAADISFTDVDGDDVSAISSAIANGAGLLVVTLSDTEKAQEIVDTAKAANVPLVFFNCSVPEAVVTSYDRCALLETDEAQIGRTQGRLAGDFLGYNFDACDVNGDGVISYAMLKDDGSSTEAASCSTYAVAAANEVLADSYGRPALFFYDAANLDDAISAPAGGWTKEAAKKVMQDMLKTYNEATDSLVEMLFVNNETAALGVIEALQEAGYNTIPNWFVPVFGVGGSDETIELLQSGAMSRTVLWDATNMANAVAQMVKNLYAEKSVFAGIDAEVDGTWRANVAYGTFTGE